MELERHISAFLRRFQAEAAPLVLGVSGGPDSMALLHGVASLVPANRVTVGHVDHGLRAESADEAAFVAEHSARLGVAFKKTRLSVDAGASGNLPARLRELRYEFLESLVPPGGFLLTAHHADDQGVTVLMRLLEGAALPGLAGMRERRDHILRPLLGVSRHAILSYLESRSIPFKRDPSNFDVRRFRNRVRERIWDAIQTERPDAGEAISAATRRLHEDDDALRQLALSHVEQIVSGPHWARLPVSAETSPAVLRRAIALVLKSWGLDFPGDRWDDVRERLRLGERANLPGRVTVEPEGDSLLFLAEEAPSYPRLDISSTGDYVLPVGILRVGALNRQVAARGLKAGDRFLPPGKNGEKTAADWLQKHGIPGYRRAGWPVVIDPQTERIIAVPLPASGRVEAFGEFAFTPVETKGVWAKKVTAPKL